MPRAGVAPVHGERYQARYVTNQEALGYSYSHAGGGHRRDSARQLLIDLHFSAADSESMAAIFWTFIVAQAPRDHRSGPVDIKEVERPPRGFKK
jgi:hypothetical protein